MIQIRQSVFETNSSSTHSITMCSESAFEKWKNGEVFLNNGWWPNSSDLAKDKMFITKEEAISLALSDWNDKWYGSKEGFLALNDERVAEFLCEHFDIYTYENYLNNYLEYFESEYTTENGDKVVAFGQYGYDG